MQSHDGETSYWPTIGILAALAFSAGFCISGFKDRFVRSPVGVATAPSRTTPAYHQSPAVASSPVAQQPSPPLPPKAREVDYARTPSELFDAYKDNEVAGDRTYLGRIVKVTGYVDEVRRGAFGDVVVEFQLPGRPIFGVSCNLRRSEEPRAANLRRGQPVTIIAECRGKSFGAVYLVDGEVY